MGTLGRPGQARCNGRFFPFLEPMKIDIKERFLRAPEVVQRTGMSRGTIYNKIHAGTFPKQIPIGANLVVWLESDVQKWMQEQIDKGRV